MKNETLSEVTPADQLKTAAVTVRPTFGIVISQDCDASRCENIVFSEIRPINQLKEFKNLKFPVTVTNAISMVKDHTRKNQKWYFLNESSDHGINEKMFADFDSIFEIKRQMLVKHIEVLRIGRLDDEVAWPHFRERVAEFFRRYPYNEWYPLNAEEASAYEEFHKKSDPNYVLDPRYWWQNP